MRMVVSLADLDESRWVNLTGVSGHPFSDHYTDQTDLWAEGETLPWAFSADAVEDAGRGHAHPAAGPRPSDPGRAGGGQHRPVVRLDRHVARPTSSS